MRGAKLSEELLERQRPSQTPKADTLEDQTVRVQHRQLRQKVSLILILVTPVVRNQGKLKPILSVFLLSPDTPTRPRCEST